jgi:hypothetical protein
MGKREREKEWERKKVSKERKGASRRWILVLRTG